MHEERRNKMVELSIIIPTLNEAENLKLLLPYLLSCYDEKVKMEVIVADGGSTDSSEDVCTQFKITWVVCKQLGRAVQMNEGAQLAKGQVLYFLHADCMPPKDFIHTIQKAMQLGAGAGCFRLKFDEDHLLLNFYGWCSQFSFTFLRFGDQSLFVRSSLFKQLLGFDETMSLLEDQDIVCRIKKADQFTLVPQSIITSSRKYQAHGKLRLQLIYTLIVGMYKLGFSQISLQKVYAYLID